jgi:hypothetical protein
MYSAIILANQTRAKIKLPKAIVPRWFQNAQPTAFLTGDPPSS